MTGRVESSLRVFPADSDEPLCTVEAFRGDVYVAEGCGGEGCVSVLLATGPGQLREVARRLLAMADDIEGVDRG